MIKEKYFFTVLWIIYEVRFVIFTETKKSISMKKILSIKYQAGAFNAALLFLRIASGVLMMNHGYDKLVHFAEYKTKFMDFMGLGPTISLGLVVFSEFFCALFIIIGLFTRISVIPLIITMGVALFKSHNGDFMGDGETATLYLACYLVLLFVGPGKVSVDGMIGK